MGLKMINPEEFQIATWSGARQSSWEMKLDRGVRVIHIPTGITATSDSERSQHLNRAKAQAEVLAQLDVVFAHPRGGWMFEYEHEGDMGNDFARVYVAKEWSDEQIFYFLRLKHVGKRGQQAWLKYMENSS